MAVEGAGASRVGIYVRISEDRDGHQTATSRQLEDCRAAAKRRGWEVVDQFEDVDLSAYKTKVRRPEFDRMLEALRAGDIDGVLVWKLDRLTRQQRDLVRVMEACEPRKAFVASVTEPIDTSETYGQFVAELLVAQARMESANTSARQRRKAVEQRQQGLPPSNGKRCFGYSRDYRQVVAPEAALVREAKDRILAGESAHSICGDWQARGIKTTGGHLWRANYLRRFLESATLAGHREHEGRFYPGQWQPILGLDDTRRLRSLFRGRYRSSGPRQARIALLTGYIRCGRCGQRMYSSRRNDATRRYVCRRTPGTTNCGRTTVLALPLEGLVLELLLTAIDGPGLAEALRHHQDDGGLLDRVRRDEEALAQLAQDCYVEERLTREEYFAARTPLVARLEENRAKLAKRNGKGLLDQFLGSSHLLRQRWEESRLDWRRAVVSACLEHVEILPGEPGRKPFDAERVAPVWRF